jgi:hypothetical protein
MLRTPDSRTKLKAALHRLVIISGAVAVRIRLAFFPNITPGTQCKRFSMCQYPRHQASNAGCWGQGGQEIVFRETGLARLVDLPSRRKVNHSIALPCGALPIEWNQKGRYNTSLTTRI